MTTEGCFPGVKRQGRVADQSPLSSAEVKDAGAIPPLPIRLHGRLPNWLSTGTTLSLIEKSCQCALLISENNKRI
jgi:hypothetical protein